MSRRLTLLTSAVVALSLLAGAACSDDDDVDPNEESTPEEQVLEGKLLALTDLPENYSEIAVAEAADQSCGGADLDLAEPLETASVAYTAADDGNTVHEAISEYEPGAVDALTEVLRTRPEACVGDSEVPLAVDGLQLPTLTDDTVALVATGQVGDQTLTLHQVFVLEGDRLIVLVHGGVAPVDVAVTEDLVRRAVAKLRGEPVGEAPPA